MREAGNRVPLRGATVLLNGRPVAETGADGRFEVRGAPLGDLEITLRSPYHETYKVTEELNKGEVLEAKYYMLKVANDPYQTVVRKKVPRREVAKVNISREELRKQPGSFGDPVRVIENLPGLARTPGGVGGALLVRGGGRDDSGIYYDGVEVPILYHFGGLTSVVNAEFLEDIDFYPGGFGARYGRATAGIVEVKTRDLDCDKLRLSGEVDLIDAWAYACVPIKDWYVAAAARRSYIDAILPAVYNLIPPQPGGGQFNAIPFYWDYQAKIHGKVGPHAFDIFGFGSFDQLRLVTNSDGENTDLNFGFSTSFHRLMLRHRVEFNDTTRLSSQVTGGFTGQTLDVSAFNSQSGLNLDVWSIDWREDFTWNPSDGFTLRAGIDAQFGTSTFNFEFPVVDSLRTFPAPTFDFTDNQAFDDSYQGYDHAYWVEGEFTLADQLKIVPGLRVDRYDFENTQDYGIHPRVAVRWEFLEGTTLKGAYGLYTQLPEPNEVIGAFGNPALRPERANQFIVGFEHRFTELLSLDIQAYTTLRDRLVETSLTQETTGTQVINETFANLGRGRTTGIDVLLRYEPSQDGFFYGWLAYTFSRTLRTPYPEGTSYTITNPDGSSQTFLYPARGALESPGEFDQPHNLVVVGQFIFPKGWEAGFRFRLTSGNPTTLQEDGQAFFDADASSYRNDLSDVPPNNGRLPVNHQLDLRVDKTWTFNKWKLTFFLEVINAYWARNVETFNYDYRFREKSAIEGLPILPVIGLKGEY